MVIPTRHRLQVGRVRGLDVLRHRTDRWHQPLRVARRQPGGRPLQSNEALGVWRRSPTPSTSPTSAAPFIVTSSRQHHGQDSPIRPRRRIRRLRHHQDGRRRDRPSGDVLGHAGLRLARADLRRPGARSAFGCVLAGMHGVRDPRRTSTVRRRTNHAPARIAAHLQSPIPSARSLRTDLPPDVDRIFAKALARSPRGIGMARAASSYRELRAAFPEGTHIFRRPPPPPATTPSPSLYTPDMAPRRSGRGSSSGWHSRCSPRASPTS